jgi:multicomponent Na+:H+ antiporter subunit C
MNAVGLPVAIYALTAILLVSLAMYGFFVTRHLIRRIVCLNMLGAGVFLMLVAIARRTPGPDPDPVPHAMVLTGIVVALSATGFALVVLRRLYDATGQSILPEDDDVR